MECKKGVLATTWSGCYRANPQFQTWLGARSPLSITYEGLYWGSWKGVGFHGVCTAAGWTTTGEAISTGSSSTGSYSSSSMTGLLAFFWVEPVRMLQSPAAGKQFAPQNDSVAPLKRNIVSKMCWEKWKSSRYKHTRIRKYYSSCRTQIPRKCIQWCHHKTHRY